MNAKKDIKSLHDITVEFHKRVFGEECARINFLPVEERKKYGARLRAIAAKKASLLGKGDFLAS